MSTTKLEEIRDFIDNTQNKTSSINKNLNKITKNEIIFPVKLKNLMMEDYYNVNILKKYTILDDNNFYSIYQIIDKYLNRVQEVYRMYKKFEKSNPNNKLINIKDESCKMSEDLDSQIIYIKDILGCLCGYMSKSVVSIMYNDEEKKITLDILEKSNLNILKKLNSVHLLRFILQAPWLVKVFYNFDLSKQNEEYNYKIFLAVIEDFLSFLDKTI